MKIEEARSILGLKPGEEAWAHLGEFEAARELIAEMVRSAPNDTIAVRYQEGLMEFDRALASVREELARIKDAAEVAKEAAPTGAKLVPPPTPPEQLPVSPPDSLVEEAGGLPAPVEVPEPTKPSEPEKPSAPEKPYQAEELAGPVDVFEVPADAVPVLPPTSVSAEPAEPPPSVPVERPLVISASPGLVFGAVSEPPQVADHGEIVVVPERVEAAEPAPPPVEPPELERGTPVPPLSAPPPVGGTLPAVTVFLAVPEDEPHMVDHAEPPTKQEAAETAELPKPTTESPVPVVTVRIQESREIAHVEGFVSTETDEDTGQRKRDAGAPHGGEGHGSGTMGDVALVFAPGVDALPEVADGKEVADVVLEPESDDAEIDDEEDVLAAKWQGGRRRRFPFGAVLMALLVVAGGGGWFWMRVQDDMRLQRQGRISFLERQGAKFVENRRWDEAGAAFAEIDTLDPGSPLGALGRRSIEAGMAEEQNQFLAYWKGEALAAFEAGRWEDAEHAIRTVVAKVPGNPEMVALERRISEERRLRERAARLDKGRKALEANRWEEAAEAARELLDKQPGDREAGELLMAANAGRERERENRGKARDLLGKAKERDTGEFDADALEWVREAARLAPGDPEVAALYQKLSGYTRTLRVPGDHESVGAAIAAARPRDRIIVGKGVWKETLVIDRIVEIEGAGAAETIIECPAADGPVATFGPDATGVRVTGVGFRHVSFAGGNERFSVAVVRGGRVQFEACRFLDASGHGLAVIEGGLVATSACRFEGNGWDGAAVYGEGSRLEVIDSQAIENIEHGIDAWSGATLVVRGSLARGNGRNGICVATPAEVTIDRNKVDGNREFGIVVTAGKGGRVTANTAERNELGGLAFHREARGLEVRDNIATRNEGPGLVLDEGFSAASMEGNQARGNGGPKQVLEGVKLDATVEAAGGR